MLGAYAYLHQSLIDNRYVMYDKSYSLLILFAIALKWLLIMINPA